MALIITLFLLHVLAEYPPSISVVYSVPVHGVTHLGFRSCPTGSSTPGAITPPRRSDP